MTWTSAKLQRMWPLGALAVLGLLLNGPLSPVASDDADKKKFGNAVEAVTAVDHRNFRIGQLIEDLSFTDLEGKTGKLSDFSGKKALVIALRTVGCPLSKKYSPRIESISKEYVKKDIAFLYVNVGEADTPDAMKAEVKKYGLSQRYVVDKKRVFAKTLAGQRTTDVFVLDSARTLVYRGAIDDQYGIGFAQNKASRHYLKEALEHLLTGE
ncbi:MAG: redoxin family protein, partial [Planctomycetota bacterium]|nr:redoxin family protein [Planctomycetota bacterium]